MYSESTLSGISTSLEWSISRRKNVAILSPTSMSKHNPYRTRGRALKKKVHMQCNDEQFPVAWPTLDTKSQVTILIDLST